MATKRENAEPILDEDLTKRRKVKDDTQRKKEEEKEKKKREEEEKRRKREEEEAEKRRKREEDKAKKEEEKAKKDEERRKKEEEREKKKREEEEKRRKREEEEAEKRRKRDEEKAKKDEERRKRDEEKERKRKEEEEKREQKNRAEEAKEAAKRRQSEILLSFLKKPGKQQPEPAPKKSQTPPPKFFENNLFKAFEVKDGMSLAPLVVRKPLSPATYKNLMNIQMQKSDYFHHLKVHKVVDRVMYKVGKPEKMMKKSSRAKLFQFHDNYRPPYYGTWRKKSKFITGRRPFCVKDEGINYEYESDEDWQNEPSDAEDINSGDEIEVEDEEDLSNDDGFFVPHGYFSEGEGEASMEQPEHHEDPELRKQRLAELDTEFQENRQNRQKRAKKKTLEPRLLGIYFGEPDPVYVTEGLAKHFMPGILFHYEDLAAN